MSAVAIALTVTIIALGIMLVLERSDFGGF
jgi:hypothetical protein